jgi:hypothetical protein
MSASLRGAGLTVGVSISSRSFARHREYSLIQCVGHPETGFLTQVVQHRTDAGKSVLALGFDEYTEQTDGRAAYTVSSAMTTGMAGVPHRQGGYGNPKSTGVVGWVSARRVIQ